MAILCTLYLCLQLTQLAPSWEAYEQLVARCTADGHQLLQSLPPGKDRDELARRIELINGPPRLFPAFPLTPSACEPADEPHPELQQWSDRWADRFLQFAGSSFRQGNIALAYEAVIQAMTADPHNMPARRALGFTCRDGYWLSPYQAYRYTHGLRWDPTWGWVNDAMLQRLRAGLRPVGTRWLPRAEAERLLQFWTNARTLETDHYRIHSTASLEDTVRLASTLEQLHWVFCRMFTEYLPEEDQLQLSFGRSRIRTLRPRRTTGSRKFVIQLYRDREQFRQAIARLPVPGKDTATGMYVPRQKRVYAYVDDSIEGGWIAATVHEATHQLFFEASTAADAAGATSHYWLVEGIAAYMESLRPDKDRVYLGEWSSPRLATARKRLVIERRFVPLERFVTFRPEQFATGDGPFLYGQAALLVHFLLHGRQGQYRRAFIDYVRAAFSPAGKSITLSGYLGVPFDELERQLVVHVAAQEW